MTHPAVFPDLNGASVFITGGGSGVGASLTDGFLAQGANVAFIGRSDANAFVDEMREKHGRAPMFLQGDITDTELLHATMAKAAEAFGPLKVLVNNAANDKRHGLSETTTEFWDWMIEVNLKGLLLCLSGSRAANAGQRWRDHQFQLDQLYDGQCRLSDLHDIKCRHHWHDPIIGARAGSAEHPRQRVGPGLGF